MTLLGVAVSTPAQANSGNDDITGCPGAGEECVLALITGLEPPVVNAVRQLRLAGNDDAATQFAADRRAIKGRQDVVQDQIDAVLTAEPDDLALPASETSATCGSDVAEPL